LAFLAVVVCGMAMPAHRAWRPWSAHAMLDNLTTENASLKMENEAIARPPDSLPQIAALRKRRWIGRPLTRPRARWSGYRRS
jgi:hypothetical protein